eukprot:4597190-Amphidinium_carterae.1
MAASMQQPPSRAPPAAREICCHHLRKRASSMPPAIAQSFAIPTGSCSALVDGAEAACSSQGVDCFPQQ